MVARLRYGDYRNVTAPQLADVVSRVPGEELPLSAMNDDLAARRIHESMADCEPFVGLIASSEYLR